MKTVNHLFMTCDNALDLLDPPRLGAELQNCLRIHLMDPEELLVVLSMKILQNPSKKRRHEKSLKYHPWFFRNHFQALEN